METDYLYSFLIRYPLLPSLALWRCMEARLFAKLELEDPVLDIGCGNGHFACVALRTPLLSGCDRDVSQVKRALSLKVYRQAVAGDICSLPYRDRSFATIICNCALEHIADLEQALQEVFRLLTPGGTFVFTVPTEKFNEWFYLSWLLRKLRLSKSAQIQIDRYNRFQFHHHIYSVREWSARLAAAGLQMERHDYYASQGLLFVWSALDDIQHSLARLGKPKGSSSEACSAQLGERFVGTAVASLMARLWWLFLTPFYRRELSADGMGAAALIRARKPASQ